MCYVNEFAQLKTNPHSLHDSNNLGKAYAISELPK